MMFIGFLIPIFLIVAIAYGIGGWRPGQSTHVPSFTQRDALEILKARHAHGEISCEGYEVLRRDLE